MYLISYYLELAKQMVQVRLNRWFHSGCIHYTNIMLLTNFNILLLDLSNRSVIFPAVNLIQINKNSINIL